MMRLLLFQPEIHADDNTGTVMQFRVTLPLASVDTSVIPAYMMHIPKINEQSASKSRYLTLNDNMDPYGRNGCCWIINRGMPRSLKIQNWAQLKYGILLT